MFDSGFNVIYANSVLSYEIKDLLRYLLCLTLISPIAHSNISRGVREIFLYPIRDYSLGVKQILLLFPSWKNLKSQISVVENED